VPDAAASPSAPELAARAAAILSRLVRLPTVAGPDGAPADPAVFDEHVRAIEESFPLLAAACERTTIGHHAQLWRWPGTVSRTARPVAQTPPPAVVLMAHQDVVPAPPGDGWSRDPFSGSIVDSRVHGRGTLDDKGDLVCTLLAAETMLELGERPRPDVYFFLGDNEETAGSSARSAVDELRRRGVSPRFVLDEGGAVVHGAFPGVRRPQAMLGLGEKGLLSVRLTVRSDGGHASAPPRLGAVDRIARALTRLHRRPFPARLTPVTRALLRHLALRSTPAMRLALTIATNAGPAGASLLAAMGGEPAALVRTTIAATRLEGSAANNVLAAQASAVLNLRLAPWDSVDAALGRLRRVIADRAVEIVPLESNEPSPVSDPDDPALRLVAAALAASHPNADLAPYITLAATDARRFHAIADNVYRFSPLDMDPDERARIHGVDESVSVGALGRGVVFYRELLGRA